MRMLSCLDNSLSIEMSEEPYLKKAGNFLKKLPWKALNHFYHPAIFSRKDIKNILVIRMNRIGDMICTIPLLKTLRKEFPHADLTLLAEETNADIIKNASYINRVLVYKKGAGIYGNRLVNLSRILGGMNFDLAIGVKAGFSSNLAITTFLSRAKYRIGYISNSRHPLELLYNLPVNKSTVIQHQVEQCLDLLSPIGITPDRFVRDISFEINDASKIRFKDFLKIHAINLGKDKIVILNISNDRVDTTWPVENFTQLIKQLQRYSIRCIITSAPADFNSARRLAETCSSNKSIVVFCETPQIMDFAAAVKEADLLICHDCGAMHIGASVGTKTLVLVGRGITPEVWGPYGDGHKCILRAKIKEITADEVFKEALRMLDIKNGKVI